MDMPKLVGNWVFFEDEGFRLPCLAYMSLNGSQIDIQTIGGEDYQFDYDDEEEDATSENDEETAGAKKARRAFELIKAMLAE